MNDNSIEKCCSFLAFAIAVIGLAVFLGVYAIIVLFIGSCVLSFIAGIIVMLSQISALAEVIPMGQNKYFAVSSFEFFKKKNSNRLREDVYKVAKETAMIMCDRKKRNSTESLEDIFVLNQKKAARRPWLTGCLGFIFVKSPMAGFYLVRTIFFGSPRENDNEETGPLDNDYIKGNMMCVGLVYAAMFILASLRSIAGICFLAGYCIFHFLFCWSKKLKHKDHMFYRPAFKCQCGQIHFDVEPSIMGAGMIFQKCECGEKFCVALPCVSKKMIAVCPVCSEALRENSIQQ